MAAVVAVVCGGLVYLGVPLAFVSGEGERMSFFPFGLWWWAHNVLTPGVGA